MLLDESPADLLRAGRAAPAAPAPTRSRSDPAAAVGGVRPVRVRESASGDVEEEPASSSQKRSTIAGDRAAARRRCRARHQSTFVTTSQSTGPPGADHASRVPAEAPVPGDQEGKQRPGVCRAGPRPRRTWARSPDPTRRAGRSRAARRRRGPGSPRASDGARRSRARRPGRRPRSARPRRAAAAGSWRSSARSRRGDVVGPAALPVDVTVPEDRVPDEAVIGCRRRAGCGARSRRARGIEAPPDDRVEARIPVPLPRVVARARARVAVVDAVALAVQPVSPQGLLRDPENAIAEVGVDGGLSQSSSAACREARNN